jgi:flagellar biosynthetic protein FlhB
MAQQADRESRTEEPAEKKILDEFEKGSIPVSREASAFAAILALPAITAFMAKDFLKSVGFTLTRLSSDPGGLQLQNGQMRRHSLRPSFGK